MKLSFGSIIFVLVIFAAIIVAGCTASSPSGPSATAAPGGATATVAPAASKAPSAPSTLGSMVDFSKLKWYEYKMTTDSTGTSAITTMRQDFNVDYQTKKANKMTMTMDSGSGASASNMVMTTYMDPSTGATLGGHMKMTAGGQVIIDKDIEPTAAASTTPGGVSTESPLTTYQGMTVTTAGTEAVHVPAGDFTATKYTWTSGDTSGAMWVAPNVPIPVKMTSSSSGMTMEMVLNGYQ